MISFVAVPSLTSCRLTSKVCWFETPVNFNVSFEPLILTVLTLPVAPTALGSGVTSALPAVTVFGKVKIRL